MIELTESTIDKAVEFGASLAGIVSYRDLKKYMFPDSGFMSGNYRNTQAMVVLALHHPDDQPQLDWWDGDSGTEGTRRLVKISRRFVGRLRDEMAIEARLVPNDVEKGGVFLKDAAVLAGLGVVGANNLLITPKYGPRVRLRALAVNIPLKTSNGLDFKPCLNCNRPCLTACPSQALDAGIYQRWICLETMKHNEKNKTCRQSPYGSKRDVIIYCRECELACPIGRNSAA